MANFHVGKRYKLFHDCKNVIDAYQDIFISQQD